METKEIIAIAFLAIVGITVIFMCIDEIVNDIRNWFK